MRPYTRRNQVEQLIGDNYGTVLRLGDNTVYTMSTTTNYREREMKRKLVRAKKKIAGLLLNDLLTRYTASQIIID